MAYAYNSFYYRTSRDVPSLLKNISSSAVLLKWHQQSSKSKIRLLVDILTNLELADEKMMSLWRDCEAEFVNEVLGFKLLVFLFDYW